MILVLYGPSGPESAVRGGDETDESLQEARKYHNIPKRAILWTRLVLGCEKEREPGKMTHLFQYGSRSVHRSWKRTEPTAGAWEFSTPIT